MRETPDIDYHCAPCAMGWRGHCLQGCDPGCDGVRDCPGSLLARMENRRAVWDADWQREYEAAYEAQRERGQQPRRLTWQEAMAELRKRYVPPG